MNKFQELYQAELKAIKKSEFMPYYGDASEIFDFALANYEPEEILYHPRMPDGIMLLLNSLFIKPYRLTDRQYNEEISREEIIDIPQEKWRYTIWSNMYKATKENITLEEAGRVLSLYKNPEKWLRHVAEKITKAKYINLTWLPTELGTNYSSGAEFFITKEHDGYWLWNTNNQIRLALFSTEDKAKEYAEHLRTI